jgi:large subunit ribosomal protein L18
LFKRYDRRAVRKKKHLIVRKKLAGTAERPRLNVFKSLSHIYAQIINDETGVTLVAVSTLDPQLKDGVAFGGNVEAACKVGGLVAKKALEQGIEQVVFDRGGYIYHGRVAALAEAAREAGLKF